jgi:polysaccharide biosynthesis protein VpsQ
MPNQAEEPTTSSRQAMNAKTASVTFLAFMVAVIVAASSGHMPPFIRTLYAFPQGDRVGHVVLFGILSFLLTAAFPRDAALRGMQIPRVALWIWLVAALEEWSQSFFPSRTADLVDFACTTIGIAGGTLVSHLWQIRQRNQPKAPL